MKEAPKISEVSNQFGLKLRIDNLPKFCYIEKYMFPKKTEKKASEKWGRAYCFIGKLLCSIAGGIVAFVIIGPFLIIPGILVGFFIGHLMAKALAFPK